MAVVPRLAQVRRMPKSMTKEDYVNFIILQLGGTVVDIELENDVGKMVDLALLKCKPFIGTTRLLTVSGTNHVDLSKYHVYTVVDVYKGDTMALSSVSESQSQGTAGDATGAGGYDAYLFSPSMFNFYDAFTGQSTGTSSMDSLVITMLSNQLMNTIRGGTSDVDFYQDGDELYIDLTGAGAGGSITIEYIPDYQDVSEITEPFWVNFILNMALALTKVALGRARSKYNISGLPYELDGDTLLSEGTTELEQLNEQLRELSDIWYVID